MDNLLKYLMFIFMAVTLTSCSGDNVISFHGPFPGMSKIEMGDVYFCSIEFGDFNDGSNGDRNPEMSWEDGAFLLSSAYNDCGSNLRVIYYGKVSSLNDIKKIPTATDKNVWNYGKKLFANGGYVIEGTCGGTLYYIRLYVTEVITNASGLKVGISYEYQFFNPTE